jgi:predicted TIM-barrel fold metal-dependent hydrolase
VIVDFHCHAGIGERMTGPWDTRADLSDYLARADRVGIRRTVVFSPFSDNYRRANRRTAAIVARYPHRLVGFACVHPARDRGRVRAMLAEATGVLGLRGVKIHGHDAPPTREVADSARALRLPVLFDPVGHPAAIELLATEYPQVAWVVPHLGSFSDDWSAQRTVIDLLVRHPNVYADTSGVRRFDLLEEAIERAGANKVLFGTDGPWLHPAVELQKVYELVLPPPSERLVLADNALRLLRNATPRAWRSRSKVSPPPVVGAGVTNGLWEQPPGLVMPASELDGDSNRR